MIYLAGKVNGSKWELVKSSKFDTEIFICSDGQKHSEHDWAWSQYSYNCSDLRLEIKEKALDAIKSCELLIAYFDTPDSFGSIAEIAYASSLGKKCFVIINTLELYCEKKYLEMFDAYWFVSHFPNVKAIECICIENAKEKFNNLLEIIL